MSDLTPGSAEWARRVSPSKAAAMLGLSPWDSPRSMWHKMRGDVPWDDETEAMERGNLCEPAVLAWWRKHHAHNGWEEQVSLAVEDWCVATPDALTTCQGDPILVEAKTSSSDWDGQVPLYHLTQVYLAMEVCARAGRPVVAAHVPMLGGRRLLFANHVVEYDPSIGADLLERCKAFYESLADEPPDLDDAVATYDAVRKVHPDIDRGAQVELPTTTALDLVAYVHDLKRLEAATRKAKSTVIDLMGDAQYATWQGVRIARRQPRGDDVTFVVVAKPTDLTDRPEENAA